MRADVLVGRKDQTATIAAVLDNARLGRAGTLMLVGEPGMGKTALLNWGLDAADTFTRLTVHGAPPDATLGFAGLLQIVRPLSDTMAQLPSGHAAVLAGACGLGPPHELVGMFRLHVALLLLLATAAEHRPLVITVDDLQWLDIESRDALLFVARRIDHDAVGMLFACRTGEAMQDGVVAAAHLPVLRVDGLSVSAANQLVETVSGVRPPEFVATSLVTATGGNPLALVEVARQLRREQLSGSEPLPSTLPLSATASRAYAALTERLPVTELDSLGLFALAEGDDETVAFAAADDVGLPEIARTRLESMGLVSFPGGKVRVRHALLASAAASRLGATRRRQLHLAIAAAMRRPTDTNELAVRRAWHLAEATQTPDEEVAAALAAIADDRQQTSSWAAAGLAFERAADLTPNRRTRARRFHAAADAAAMAGYDDWSLDLLNRAREIVDDQIMRARLDHARGVRHIVAGRCRTAWQLLPAAAATLKSDYPHDAAAVLADAALAALLAGRLDDARMATTRAKSLSLRPEIELAADVVEGMTAIHRGDLAVALARLSALAGRPDLLACLVPVVEYVVPLAIGLTWVGEYAAATTVADQVVELLRGSGAFGVLPAALYVSAYANAWQGRLHIAYLLASEAKSLADEGANPQWRFLATGCLALIEAMRGNLPECRRLATAADQRRADTELWHPRDVEDALGLAALCDGDTADAVRLLESAATPEPMGTPYFGRPTTPDLVESCVRAGHVVPVAVARQIEAAVPEDYPVVAAAVWRCRALLGTADSADAFESALTGYAQANLPWQEARTQLAYGERLRRSGRRIDARQQLRNALHLFESTGSTAWADRAAAELSACGGDPHRTSSVSTAVLTPQELQTALTVANGATNREAAAALFLSPKTVEMHLTHIYRKLGIRSRADLAARFAGAAPQTRDTSHQALDRSGSLTEPDRLS